MSLFKPVALLVGVSLALSSCATFKNSRQLPNTNPFICPQAAYLDMRQFELEGPKTEAEFLLYAADMAIKYPQLKDAYTLLYQCVDKYHPIPKELPHE